MFMCVSEFRNFLAILETNIARKLPILQNSCYKVSYFIAINLLIMKLNEDSLTLVGDLFEILGERLSL